MLEDGQTIDLDQVRKTRAYQKRKKQWKDRNWRLDNFYFIQNEEGDTIPFVRNAAQRAFCDESWSRDLLTKARQLGFCHSPSMRVLLADRRWVPIGTLQVGDELVSVDENAPNLGKGHRRKMRRARVEAVREVFDDAFRITLENGVKLIATGPHRYLCKIRGGEGPVWRTVYKMKVGDEIRALADPWGDTSIEDGWFGGLLDGEGSMRQKPEGGFELCVSQVPGAVLDRARTYLNDRGYTFREDIDTRQPGVTSKLGKKPVHKLVLSRTGQAFRLLGQTRPTRFINQSWWEDHNLLGDGSSWRTVVAIEELPKQRMIDIQTSTKTFICEGVVSHNSTEILIEILDLCVFRSGQTCGVIDVTLKDARKKLAKIKFAYDRLPDEIKVNIPLKKANTEELEWENGSSVTVGVSYRGGTLQFLHISEFGKISVNSPDVAREIKTGAMRAVHSTGRIVVESTAHGTAGEFYDMVKLAEDKMKVGETLTSLDFRPHLFGWWMKPEYRLPNNLVVITQELEDYFRKLAPVLKERHGLVLDADQMAWYAKQYADLGPDDVKAEMPTVREEAFYNSLVGAFWKRELSRAREDGRIGQMVPFDPTRRVNTFWAIGEDTTAIWWHQTDGIRHRLIDYYEEEGWSLQGACGMIDEKRRDRKFIYDKHYGPHDMGNKDWGNNAQTDRKSTRGLGVDISVVDRITEKADAIEACRRFINNSWFDA